MGVRPEPRLPGPGGPFASVLPAAGAGDAGRPVLIDAQQIRRMMRDEGLGRWADVVDRQIHAALVQAPHGDWQRWQQALRQLPSLGSGRVDCGDGAVGLFPDRMPDEAARTRLLDALKGLHPWRKGPYRVADIRVDTEWRSDWKWDRLLPHIAPLAGRLVMDVGCGNGYHCWRMADAGARRVIGVDPTALFIAQFLAIRQLMQPMDAHLVKKVSLLPFGIEAVPDSLARFDTVFSMGVLYHRRSPVDHLSDLRRALRPGGQLVLETLVVEGDDRTVLVPRGRYAKMRNVWFIPSPAMLENWLRRCGYRDVRTADVTPTTGAEQRSTEWMRFESLADFLDPADRGLTIEGYPAPLRAVVIAEV